MSTEIPGVRQEEVVVDEQLAIEHQPSATPQSLWRRLVEGDLGSLRVLLVLAIIWTVFAVQNDRFLTATNLTNLALQIAAVGTISVGVVLVLLLGEIDLSVGAVSGLSASIMAVLAEQHGWSAPSAILAGLCTGAVIGLFQGTIVTWLEIPSFVVTLAGLLGWQGVQLKVLGTTGTVNVTSPGIVDLAGTFLAPWLGWLIAIAAIAIVAGGGLLDRSRRARAELELEPVGMLVIRVVLSAAAVLISVAIMNSDRGVPLSTMILIAFVVFFNWLVTRTRWGRHLMATGGNIEAARRAGVGVRGLRTMVFVLASTMAAAGGILAASRLLAVNQSSGSGDLLLLSIAGPVIAGVSLFGGRGSVWGALTGALVIGSISNGMDLLGYESAVKFMVTGAVLLGAVVLDALSRKRRVAGGRAA